MEFGQVKWDFEKWNSLRVFVIQKKYFRFFQFFKVSNHNFIPSFQHGGSVEDAPQLVAI